MKGIVAQAERDDAGISITAIKEENFEQFREEIISNAQDPHAVDMEILSNFEHSPDLY